MKLFAVLNYESRSDFDLKDDFRLDADKHSYSSNAHSGGAVILAETLEQAQELLQADGTLVEVPLDKPGVVLFADGDC